VVAFVGESELQKAVDDQLAAGVVALHRLDVIVQSQVVVLVPVASTWAVRSAAAASISPLRFS